MSIGISVVREWIDGNIEEITTCQDVADYFCVALESLRKRFDREEGSTLLDHVRNAKLERVKHLLHSERLLCYEIAYRLKLGSPQYGARVFKRRFGMTMIQLRKQLVE